MAEISADIMMLNNDCIIEIFRWLKFDDRINFARSNERFMNVFKLKEKYDTINLDEDRFMDKKKLQAFLDCFGSDIKTINSFERSSFSIDCIELISKFCINLQTVKLFEKMIDQDLILFANVITIKSLSLVHCMLQDKHLQQISNFPNLETLDIRYNGDVYGNYLSRIQNLKHLNLIGCVHIQHDNFESFCINNSELISLQIGGCIFLNTLSLKTLAMNCKKIESLKINGYLVTNEILKQFTDLMNLSELDISYCSGFTTEGLLNFLRYSPQLKVIEIKNCRQIREDFLPQAIELLKVQVNEAARSNCCKIVTTLKKDEKIIDLIKDDTYVLITWIDAFWNV